MTELAATAVLSRNIALSIQLCGPCADPEPPAPEMHVFAVQQMNIVGEFSDSFSLSGNLTFISKFDGAALATFVKDNYSPDSGAGLTDGDGGYGLWILAETAPTDWLWNGVAIEWNDLGVAEKKCWEGNAVFFDASIWLLFVIGSTVAAFTTQGAAPTYTDAGLQAYLDIFIPQVCGVGSSAVVNATDTDVQIIVSNTYLPLNSFTSSSGSSQLDSFIEISCP